MGLNFFLLVLFPLSLIGAGAGEGATMICCECDHVSASSTPVFTTTAAGMRKDKSYGMKTHHNTGTGLFLYSVNKQQLQFPMHSNESATDWIIAGLTRWPASRERSICSKIYQMLSQFDIG